MILMIGGLPPPPGFVVAGGLPPAPLPGPIRGGTHVEVGAVVLVAVPVGGGAVLVEVAVGRPITIGGEVWLVVGVAVGLGCVLVGWGGTVPVFPGCTGTVTVGVDPGVGTGAPVSMGATGVVGTSVGAVGMTMGASPPLLPPLASRPPISTVETPIIPIPATPSSTTSGDRPPPLRPRSTGGGGGGTTLPACHGAGAWCP
jgi:hypothetical protein